MKSVASYKSGIASSSRVSRGSTKNSWSRLANARLSMTKQQMNFLKYKLRHEFSLYLAIRVNKSAPRSQDDIMSKPFYSSYFIMRRDTGFELSNLVNV